MIGRDGFFYDFEKYCLCLRMEQNFPRCALGLKEVPTAVGALCSDVPPLPYYRSGGIPVETTEM